MYVSSFTSGVISKEAEIIVRLREDVDELKRIDYQVLNAISNINVLNSEASVIEDRQRILDSINETVGCETMSHEIAVVLVDAMAESLLELILSKQSMDLQSNKNIDSTSSSSNTNSQSSMSKRSIKTTNTSSSTKLDIDDTTTTTTASTVIGIGTQKTLTTYLRLSWRASELLFALGWTEQASNILSNAIKECNVIEILQLEKAVRKTAPTTIDGILAMVLQQDTETILLQTEEEHTINIQYVRELLSFANHAYSLQLASQRQELSVAKDSSPDSVTTVLAKLKHIVSAFRSILQMRIILLGKHHRETLGTCNNLANALINVDQFDEAHIHHNETYNERLEKYGQDHIDVLQSLNNIASLHDARGNLFYQQCCDNWNFDDDADNTNALSLLNSANNEWKRAVDILKQVASRREIVLGHYHMETINALINVAHDLLKQVDSNDVYYNYGESMIYYNKALVRLQLRYGYKNPNTLDCADTIATTMDVQGNDTTGAIALLENMLNHINLHESGQERRGQKNESNNDGTSSDNKNGSEGVYNLKHKMLITNVQKIQKHLELLRQEISPHDVDAANVVVQVQDVCK